MKIGVAVVAFMFGFTAFAQEQLPPMPALPVDSAVRVGVLDNGLTYYIRHNETPKGQADFYIAQKVGSILEEEHQRGLAHFLEHMCFNGTEHFPGKGIIEYLESVGVKFGYNLNAYTSVDETVYNISSVPVARTGVQDSCLLILHDWACALLLDSAEIEAERGVIHEEWRRSMVGQMRILENLLPVVYPNNRYGQRLPIGTMEVVDNFPRQAIYDYYKTWYRPDQQGIIVVGDIDVDYIEGKIKELFGPIPMPENAKERVYYPVEDTPGTIYAIGKDVEMQMPVTLMFFKTDKLVPESHMNTSFYFRMNYIVDVIMDMLNARVSEMSNDPNCPFAQAAFEYDDFFLSRTKDAVTMQVIGKGGDMLPSFGAAYRELLRAVKGGFTQSELDRANAEIRSRYQRLYDSRNNTPSERYSREYASAFTEGEPIPGIALEKQFIDELTAQISLQVINAVAAEMIEEDNRVVLMMLPDAEGFAIPTEEEVAAVIAAIDAEDLDGYEDNVKEEPLIPNLPAPGAIVSEQHLDEWDATEWTLSNGVKVVVKPTTFKDNEIKFSATALGGYSQMPEEASYSIIASNYTINNNGLGDYTNNDLTKYLKGKEVSLSFNCGDYTRDLEGASTIQDLPTLMELIFAYFTEFTISEEEFAATQQMLTAALSNQEATPQYQFLKLAYENMYKSSHRRMLSSEVANAANRDITVNMVRSMLANPTDYTFYFVGNIDIETFKPLVEQYIATLPIGESAYPYVINPDSEVTPGTDTISQSIKMETPQVWALYMISGRFDYTAHSSVVASIASQILSKRLLYKVREEMGATYSIGASGSMSRVRGVNTTIQIAFPMKPEMRDEVFAAIDTILSEMETNVTEDELNPVKEYLVKNAVANMEENTGWLSAMIGVAYNGVNTFIGRSDVVNAVTTQDVMDFFKALRAQGNQRIVILNPAE